MHVIAYTAIRAFVKDYPQYESALNTWFKLVEKTDYTNFNELRQTFPTADKVGKCTVFNIHGNAVRLIAAIHYNRKKVYIRHVLTHTEYDKGHWKTDCQPE